MFGNRVAKQRTRPFDALEPLTRLADAQSEEIDRIDDRIAHVVAHDLAGQRHARILVEHKAITPGNLDVIAAVTPHHLLVFHLKLRTSELSARRIGGVTVEEGTARYLRWMLETYSRTPMVVTELRGSAAAVARGETKVDYKLIVVDPDDGVEITAYSFRL